MSNRPRNIRNTQYPVQIPVVTQEEFDKLTPELGAMVLLLPSNKFQIVVLGEGEGEVVWSILQFVK